MRIKPASTASTSVTPHSLLILLTLVLVFVLMVTGAPAQGSGSLAGQTSTPIRRVTLIDNARVVVDRLTFLPAQRTDLPDKTHTDPRDVVVVQLTPGDIYMNTGEITETGHQDAGKVWWISSPHGHSLANVGMEPFDLITVHLKELAPANSAQPAPPTTTSHPTTSTSPAPVNYMHRHVQFENDRVIVALETMDIGQRTDAPGRVHADPRDGILIMTTPGNIEFNTGQEIEIGHQEIGKTWWMPKPPFLHSVANFGFTPSDPGGPFNFILVSLK
jgi:hypothetical protein